MVGWASALFFLALQPTFNNVALQLQSSMSISPTCTAFSAVMWLQGAFRVPDWRIPRETRPRVTGDKRCKLTLPPPGREKTDSTCVSFKLPKVYAGLFTCTFAYTQTEHKLKLNVKVEQMMKSIWKLIKQTFGFCWNELTKQSYQVRIASESPGVVFEPTDSQCLIPHALVACKSWWKDVSLLGFVTKNAVDVEKSGIFKQNNVLSFE